MHIMHVMLRPHAWHLGSYSNGGYCWTRAEPDGVFVNLGAADLESTDHNDWLFSVCSETQLDQRFHFCLSRNLKQHEI